MIKYLVVVLLTHYYSSDEQETVVQFYNVTAPNETIVDELMQEYYKKPWTNHERDSTNGSFGWAISVISPEEQACFTSFTVEKEITYRLKEA